MKTFKEYVTESVEPLTVPKIKDKVYEYVEFLGGDIKDFDIKKQTKNYNTLTKAIAKFHKNGKYDKDKNGKYTRIGTFMPSMTYEDLEKIHGTKSILKFLKSGTVEFSENEPLENLKNDDVLEYFIQKGFKSVSQKDMKGAEAHILGSNWYSTISGLKVINDGRFISLETNSYVGGTQGRQRCFRAGIRFPYGLNKGEIWKSWGKDTSTPKFTPKTLLKEIQKLDKEAERELLDFSEV